MFHLINLARERGVDALITARAPPDAWGLKTADLLSRLRLAPIVELGAPDLELTQAVLVKLFNDRQLAVDPALIGYVALRIERSLDAARALVAALDREAWPAADPSPGRWPLGFCVTKINKRLDPVTLAALNARACREKSPEGA